MKVAASDEGPGLTVGRCMRSCAAVRSAGSQIGHRRIDDCNQDGCTASPAAWPSRTTSHCRSTNPSSGSWSGLSGATGKRRMQSSNSRVFRSCYSRRRDERLVEGEGEDGEVLSEMVGGGADGGGQAGRRMTAGRAGGVEGDILEAAGGGEEGGCLGLDRGGAHVARDMAYLGRSRAQTRAAAAWCRLRR